MNGRHKVFISYHHNNDQWYANEIRDFYGENDAIIDRSLPEKVESHDNDYVMGVIRTKYLRDSTVTVVLIGELTWSRKWIDWEIYSSLRPYKGPYTSRKENGLLGVLLPGAYALPLRFADNFQTFDLIGHPIQTGYARLTTWEAIAPPVLWRVGLAPHNLLIEKTQRLSSLVHEAWVMRETKTHLIHNKRPRFQADMPIIMPPGSQSQLMP